MFEYFKSNWYFFSISSLIIGGILYFFPKNETVQIEKKPEYVKVIKPKSDSVIHVIDSVLKVKKENDMIKEIAYKKKQQDLEKELRKERNEKLKKEKQKPKVIVHTKEIVVEKVIKDTTVREVIVENYKIQEENRQLKRELEKKYYENESLRNMKTYKDTIQIDTIKKKKKRWFF